MVQGTIELYKTELLLLELFKAFRVLYNHQYLARVYNDAICTRMLQMLHITCGFFREPYRNGTRHN